MTRIASRDWKSAYPRQPKSASHLVSFVGGHLEFDGGRYTINAAQIECLNSVLIELGYCPVRMVTDLGPVGPINRFVDDRE